MNTRFLWLLVLAMVVVASIAGITVSNTHSTGAQEENCDEQRGLACEDAMECATFCDEARSCTECVAEDATACLNTEVSCSDNVDASGAGSAVVTLTDGNFAEDVTDSANNAMVDFYAPWCSHCMELKPEYEKLAKTFKDDPSVLIGAMDATANQVPAGYDVQWYPSIFYVPAVGKQPVSYDGERTAEAMEEFIRAQLNKR